MVVALFAVLWSLQMVAGPFYATYMLRDLHMPFLGVGIVNAFFMVAFLASGPFWGRAVNRWGCRPIITVCAGILGPVQLTWYWMDSPGRIYAVITAVNLVAGFVVGGVSVALNTLIYKVTPAAGRSVQLAVYSILVVLLAAPLPAIGGHVPDWLSAFGLARDLRYTFYAAGLFVALSAVVSRLIREPDSCRAREVIRTLGSEWLTPLRRWFD
jgi:MFS family permease